MSLQIQGAIRPQARCCHPGALHCQASLPAKPPGVTFPARQSLAVQLQTAKQLGQNRLTCKVQSGRQEQETVSQSEPSTSAPASQTPGGRISSFVAATFLAGAIQGPLLDGIHGTVELNHYDSLPVNVLGLHSSVWIPPLLGAFYAVLGSLHVFTDSVALQSPSAVRTMRKLPGGTALARWLQDPRNAAQTQEILQEKTSWPAVALATGALAWLLEVSANLYQNDVPYWQIHAVLAGITFFNFGTLDGTRQGLLLGGICAVGSPLSEVVIMNLFGLWHYPHPDFLGLPSWVMWCYAFYTPALGNLARALWLSEDASERAA